uniref:Uncharacterized protein n=1 Tax=Ciona savignyi TaxID=51511 RepID=H2ZIC6_CIOSA
MALWLPCRLVVLLELFILWHSFKPCTADIHPLDGVCKLNNETVFDQYASTLIPPEKRFMLFVSNILTGLKDVESIAYNHVKCTGAINNDVIIQPCNSSKLSQKWFQTQNHLINIALGKCLTSNVNQGNQLSLADCKLNDHNQKWVCSGGNDISSILSSNGHRISYINESQTLQLVQAETEWNLGIAGKDAIPVHQATAVTKLCVAQNPFCSRPNPGVRSQLVTSQVAIQKLLHLPQKIILKHSEDAFKHCYSVGEVVLTVCPIGHVAIGSQSKMYQASTCLGGGLWSEQHPLHCVKRRCGRPKDGFHSTFLPETVYWYGDVVRYTCQADCLPDSSTRICGPDGQWSGSPLNCKHSCYFSLNRNSGTVRSPNYPQPYPPKTNCKWFIKVGEGLRLVLWFRDFFIEPGSPFTTNCRHDVFYVNDTNLRDGITQYCGSLYPEHWIATGN